MVMFTLEVGDTPKLDAVGGATGENVTRKQQKKFSYEKKTNIKYLFL